jgi:hypothetical protein
MLSKSGIIKDMNSRHRKTLAAIFSRPTPRTLVWDDIKALLKNIGCEVIEGDGSRIGFELENHRIDFHRPHPGKEAKPYQIKAVREYLKNLGVTP